MIQNVAIIGATGMLGQPVTKAFIDAGYSVRVISRDVERAKRLFNNKQLEFKEADIFNVAQLKVALKDIDAIHINLSGNSPESYTQNHVHGTTNILECADSKTTQLITMISTASAYPNNDFRVDTKAKLTAENLLKNSRYPYICYLPSWFFETLNLLVDNNTVTTMCDSTQELHWLSAQDFANSVVKSYSNSALYNRRLSLIGPEPMTITSAADQYAQAKGLTRLHLDATQAWAYAQDLSDDTMFDALDLLEYTEKVGEVIAPETLTHSLEHSTTLSQWLANETTS